MNDKQIKVLGEAPVVKAILKMALPVVTGMMVQVLYNLVDTFFVGQLGDPNQLAAANITTPLFMIMMAIAGIIGTGASSYISRSLGEKNYERANKTLSTGVAIVIGLGVIVMVLGLIFLSPLMKALGASEQTLPFAYDYSFVLFLGSILIMCNYSLGQLARSEGAAMSAMMGMALGTVVNIILDPLFIFGLGMGIRGAAIATVIGNAVGLSYYIYFYGFGKSAVKIRLKSVGLDKNIWGQIFGIGTPATVSQLLMSVATIILNNLAVFYGDEIVAGMGVASKIMTIGTFVFMGFAGGCQPLIGYNYGAKNYSRVNEVIKKAMLMTVGIGIVLFAVFGIFTNGLISVFASDMPKVVNEGVVILRALMWSLIVVGPMMLATVTVQAFGKAKASLFLSVARQGMFYIPLMFILNYLFKFNGLIYAHAISDVVAMVLALVVLRKILKKAEIEHTIEKESKGNISTQQAKVQTESTELVGAGEQKEAEEQEVASKQDEVTEPVTE